MTRELSLIAKIIVLSLLVAACDKKPAPVRPAYEPPREEYYVHTIKQGETLGMLAKWYTGASSNWQIIQSHNPGLDARKLRPGMMVRIPRNFMIRSNPMPRNPGSVTASDKTAPQESGKASIKSDSFGTSSGASSAESELTGGDFPASGEPVAPAFDPGPTADELAAREEAAYKAATNSAVEAHQQLENSGESLSADQNGNEEPSKVKNIINKLFKPKDQPQGADSAPPADVPPGTKTRDQLLKELTEDY